MFQGPRLRWDQTLSLTLVVVMTVVSPALATQPPAPPRQQVALLQPAPVPTLLPSAATSSANPNLIFTLNLSSAELLAQRTANTIYVSDEASGTVLLSKNADQAVYPASTTKIMTALVARETYYMSQILTVKEEAFAEGNTMGLLPGEQISVNQLLHGLLISSGNDAAFVLASNHPEGYDGFVAAMNLKAKQLGLSSTNFANPSGLDAPGHLMTAHDLAILSREVFKDEVLATMLSTVNTTATDVSGKLVHQLGHTHELLYTDQTAKGGKTGTTEGAGQVLVTRFLRPDLTDQPREILVVVMGSQDRYTDTKTLIDWVMANYQWQEVKL